MQDQGKKAMELLERALENAERQVEKWLKALESAASLPLSKSNVDKITAASMALKVSMVQKRVVEWLKQTVKQYGASTLPPLAAVILAIKTSEYTGNKECPLERYNNGGYGTLLKGDEVELAPRVPISDPEMLKRLRDLLTKITFSPATLKYVLEIEPMMLLAIMDSLTVLAMMHSLSEGSHNKDSSKSLNQCLRDLLSVAKKLTLEEALAILEFFALCVEAFCCPLQDDEEREPTNTTPADTTLAA
ncbi:MAG: hypothetical protein ACOX2O_00265 [Bdellovibrionota bacterium]|jgi:hypothetical protein